jgi:hypothetical protein
MLQNTGNTVAPAAKAKAAWEIANAVIGANPVRNRSLGAGGDGSRHTAAIGKSAAGMNVEAGPLLRALEDPRVVDAFRRYDKCDRDAQDAQRWYKLQQHALFWPVVIALAAGLLSFILPMKDMANGYVRQLAHRDLDATTVHNALTHSGLIAGASWFVLSMIYIGATRISWRPAAAARLATFGEWCAGKTSSVMYWPAAALLGAALVCTAHLHWTFASIVAATSIALIALRMTQRNRQTSDDSSRVAAYLRGTDHMINRENFKLAVLLLLIAAGCGASYWIDTPSRYAAYAKTLHPDDVELGLRVAAARTVFVSLSIASALALCLRPISYYQKWNEARGTAEAFRRALFERIMDAKVTENPGDLPRLPLFLEYFRRYQIELQQAYFDTRGQEHEWSAKFAKGLEWTVVAGLVAWCIADLGTAWSGTSEQGAAGWPRAGASSWTWASGHLQSIETSMSDVFMLGTSVVLALIAAGAKLHVMLNASIRNAPRYAGMRENFSIVKTELDTVRAAAANGDEAAVRAYMARVHSIMSNELGDWVKFAELDGGQQPKVPAQIT